MATTTPGGAYLVNGRLVNANGEPIVEQPEAVEPEAIEQTVDEPAPQEPEAVEPEAVVASPKRKRKS